MNLGNGRGIYIGGIYRVVLLAFGKKKKKKKKKGRGGRVRVRFYLHMQYLFFFLLRVCWGFDLIIVETPWIYRCKERISIEK